MAFVTRQLLGITHGTVGELVYKNRRGKSYVNPKPRKYKKTKSPDLIKNRNGFGLASKFASVLNETEYLAPIWKLTKLPGKSGYHRILKYNYNYCRYNFVHFNAKITPGGKYLNNVKIDIDDDSMEISFNATKEVADNFEPPYVLIAVVYLYQPFAEETPDNRQKFMVFQQEITGGTFSVEEINILPLLIDEGTFKIIHDYKKVVVFFTVISIENKTNETIYTNGRGHCFKGFEFFDAEMMALRDLKPKKPPPSDEPVNIFRIR